MGGGNLAGSYWCLPMPPAWWPKYENSPGIPWITAFPDLTRKAAEVICDLGSILSIASTIPRLPESRLLFFAVLSPRCRRAVRGVKSAKAKASWIGARELRELQRLVDFDAACKGLKGHTGASGCNAASKQPGGLAGPGAATGTAGLLSEGCSASGAGTNSSSSADHDREGDVKEVHNKEGQGLKGEPSTWERQGCNLADRDVVIHSIFHSLDPHQPPHPPLPVGPGQGEVLGASLILGGAAVAVAAAARHVKAQAR